MITFLVGFLLVVWLWFPILDNRLRSPWYEILFVLAGALFVLFTFSTCKIYQRVSQIREL